VLLPFTSQGANSALEDARVLAACLTEAERTGGRLPGALAEYERVRRAPLERCLQAGRDLAAAFVEPRTETAALPLVM
jgi:salicylate hydroxylase